MRRKRIIKFGLKFIDDKSVFNNSASTIFSSSYVKSFNVHRYRKHRYLFPETDERERETRGQSKLDRHIKSLLGENSFGNGRYRRMPGEILFVTLRVHFL